MRHPIPWVSFPSMPIFAPSAALLVFFSDFCIPKTKIIHTYGHTDTNLQKNPAGYSRNTRPRRKVFLPSHGRQSPLQRV